MRARSLTTLLVGTFLAATLGGCDLIPEELGGEPDETATPTGTATPTPTNTPDPDPTPNVTTSGDIITYDFGTIALPSGESPTFAIDVPGTAIGIDFIINGAAADAAKIFAFFDLEAPGNRTVIDNSTDGPVRQGYNNGVMSFAVPADDSGISNIAAGVWTFHVAAFNGNGSLASSNPQVLAKVRTASGGTVPNGLVDLNVIVVDGVTFGTAQQTEVTNALAHMSDLYSTIGLAVGDVDYFSLPDSSFAIVSSASEMESLLATSADIPDNRVNLYIVGDLQGDLNGAAGIAGGIPIPMDLNGTIHSGVVLYLQGSAVGTGEVMAHEVGHSLGLYHTTEFAGQGFDPISDSVTCPEATITSNPGACPDSTNVMFPQLTGDFATFTAGQGMVVRPTVHVRNPGTTAFVPTAFQQAPREFGPTGRVLTCRRVGTSYVVGE